MISLFGDDLLPRRRTMGSAGYDFAMPVRTVVPSHGSVTMDSGIRMEDGDIPEGFVMLIMPRSSLGMRHGLRQLNTVGVIDSDYRGSIRFALTADDDLLIERGERFAQGVIVPYAVIPSEVPPTEERTGGIGSTGRMA